MKQFVSALYGEGPTDYRFLQPLVARTAQRLLAGYAEVLDPHPIRPPRYDSGAEMLLAAAREARGMHVLFVHADADARGRDRALAERVAPGRCLVEQRVGAGGSACRHIVPVVPVRCIESWMLADPPALKAVIGTPLSVDDFGLPGDVEAVADPKGVLDDLLRRSVTGRRRPIRRGELYAPLGARIPLDALDRVPSFQAFKAGLQAAFVALRFLPSEAS